MANGLFDFIKLFEDLLIPFTFYFGFEDSLVPTFSEFLVPVVFTSFKPFLLRGERVPPTLVIIRRLGFQSPFFTQIKTSSFHRLFFCLFFFLPSAKYKESQAVP